MTNKINFLLYISLLLYLDCSISTESLYISPSKTVTMTTDSLKYTRISNLVRVKIHIKNNTDSTLVFPACGNISTRIDTKSNGEWILGFPSWLRVCPAIFPFTYVLASDSSYYDIIGIDTSGKFRIVSYYHILSKTSTDTLFSNEFTIF